jgi:hypothetical protein
MRAAATLLSHARGLDSMSDTTSEVLRWDAIELREHATWLEAIEREMNEHVAQWRRRRVAAAGRSR